MNVYVNSAIQIRPEKTSADSVCLLNVWNKKFSSAVSRLNRTNILRPCVIINELWPVILSRTEQYYKVFRGPIILEKSICRVHDLKYNWIINLYFWKHPWVKSLNPTTFNMNIDILMYDFRYCRNVDVWCYVLCLCYISFFDQTQRLTRTLQFSFA